MSIEKWAGVLLGLGAALVAIGVGVDFRAFNPDPACQEFDRFGYHTVPSNNRSVVYVEEFRVKSRYEPSVRLYASPYRNAYSGDDPCNGQGIIVLPLEYINTWSDDELRAIVGHELGHKLAERHANPTVGNSDRGQSEADGYGIELAGEYAFAAYWRRCGLNEVEIIKKLDDAKLALDELRKRAPLP